MSRKQAIKHIIVQAGGEGTRMLWHTRNKPKALVSIASEPIIFSLMRQHPQATFYIKAGYKADILTQYMEKFGQDFNYKIITTQGEGSATGIKAVLEHLPANEYFALVWCDLYWQGPIYPDGLDLNGKNYIGLSQTFPCRWSFQNGQLEESPSNENGVAGVYIFKNKSVLKNIAEQGEFCRYLQTEGIAFDAYHLDKVKEVGTIEVYDNVVKDLPVTRPFNRFEFKTDRVIKYPVNDQGRQLAKHETAWYKSVQKNDFDFLPKIYSMKPLTLERLQGESLHKLDLPNQEKKKALKDLIEALHTLHGVQVPDSKVDRVQNDRKAIITKTKDRLNTVHDIIPYANDEKITINGKVCTNWFLKWDAIEDVAQQFFGKTDYVFIHGDSTLSNTVYDPNAQKVFIIDPRGYYADAYLEGDPDYDWAKLYYSIVGNYDMFNQKNFKLDLSEGKVELDIESIGWSDLEAEFFELTRSDKKKITFLHAIIWLSLASYAWDNYDSICGAFYNGIYLLEEYMSQYEKTL